MRTYYMTQDRDPLVFCYNHDTKAIEYPTGDIALLPPDRLCEEVAIRGMTSKATPVKTVVVRWTKGKYGTEHGRVGEVGLLMYADEKQCRIQFLGRKEITKGVGHKNLRIIGKVSSRTIFLKDILKTNPPPGYHGASAGAVSGTKTQIRHVDEVVFEKAPREQSGQRGQERRSRKPKSKARFAGRLVGNARRSRC